jgi:hypothetical protein
MSQTAAPSLSSSSTRAGLPAAIAAPVMALCALAGIGFTFLSGGSVNWIESVTAASLLAILLIVMAVLRGPAGAARAPHGRVLLAALFVLTLLNFSPAALRIVLMNPPPAGESSTYTLAVELPLIAAILLVVLNLCTARPVPAGQSGAEESRLEALLCNWRLRVNAVVVGIGLLAGGLMLSRYPLAHLLPLALLVVAAALSLRPLLALAAQPLAGGILALGLAVSLGLNAGQGIAAWSHAGALVEQAGALVASPDNAPAEALLQRAREENVRVQSKSLQVEIERQSALMYEQRKQYESAFQHWRQMTSLLGVDFEKYPAVRSLYVALGDSLHGWRQLLYKGFQSVMNDELLRGYMALGERPDADVRGRLLCALIAWERGDDEAARRKRLETVLAARPNDVTAACLLSTLGKPATPLPTTPLFLGPELIVGKEWTEHAVSGSILDLGSVQSVVFLTEGRWECRVQARGTPLNEEWPVLRVDIDGEEALRTRVDRAATMDLPFAFDVKRAGLYRMKFIFENPLTVFQGADKSFRGLTIEGVYFQRAGS